VGATARLDQWWLLGRSRSRCGARSHLRTRVRKGSRACAGVRSRRTPLVLRSGNRDRPGARVPGTRSSSRPSASNARCTRDAALEAATASEVCAHAKEGARDALLANRLPGGTPTIQRSTASPSSSPGRFTSYISSTVIRLLLTFPGLRSRFDDSCSHIAITPHVQISYDAAQWR
jgi:hypothetical protein